jgi:hypothetical protein
MFLPLCPRGHRHPWLFYTASLLTRFTFYLQPQKANKKGRYRAMLFIQLLGKFSRVLLVSLEALLRQFFCAVTD